MTPPPSDGRLRRGLWQRLKGNSYAEQMLADAGLHEQERRERAEILAVLPDFTGQRVIDVGAGVGRFTAEFAARAREVVAVDFLPEALETNRTRNASHTNVEYRCTDATHLELEPRSADLIFSNWLLMYLSEDEIRVFLEHCGAWLTPSGRIFFKESCETNVLGYGPVRITVIGLLQKLTGLTIDRHISTAPTAGEIWRWLTRQKTEQSIYYRKAVAYDRLFAEHFETERSGYVQIFAERYGNRNQRYWLLRPKPRGTLLGADPR